MEETSSKCSIENEKCGSKNFFTIAGCIIITLARNVEYRISPTTNFISTVVIMCSTYVLILL